MTWRDFLMELYPDKTLVEQLNTEIPADIKQEVKNGD